MVRFAEILCPVDLSEASAHALDHALAMARRYEAHVTVIEVSWAGLPPIAYPGSASMPTPPLLLPQQLHELQEELRLFATRRSIGDVKMDLVVREGAVVPSILGEARATGSDLIVIGTHGRSGFDHLFLGSVAEKVIRKADCAVMTVPPADATTAPARGGRTIVCGVDFSPASLKAVDYARSIAHELQATVVLTHVVDWHTHGAVPPEVELETAAYRGRVEGYNELKLQALVSDDDRTWCQTEEHVAVGRPHEEIVRLARERDADFIVMGDHGRSALNLALFGSTTNQVVRHSRCPVLTVRA